MSPLASCLEGSNVPTVWGRRLDNLKKEKYATNSSAR